MRNDQAQRDAEAGSQSEQREHALVEPITRITRRGFLKGAVIGGVAAVAATLLPTLPRLPGVLGAPKALAACQMNSCGTGGCTYVQCTGCWWVSGCSGSCGAMEVNACLVHVRKLYVVDEDEFGQCLCGTVCDEYYEYWCGQFGCCY